MTLLEAIKERHSVRKYEDKPLAPTAVNQQKFKFFLHGAGKDNFT